MSFRHQYIIGDLQGCFASFVQLLDEIKFNPAKDKVWLAGDLVARGEDSLSTLRMVKFLCEKGCAATVLGNHDINLIAVWRGYAKLKKKDKTADIFSADDSDELLNWLRKQPLLLQPNDTSILVHAGIPPNWSIKQAITYAKELEQILAGDIKKLDNVLPNLYSKKADEWSDNLSGYVRLRSICNYFTRMRLCDKDGLLEFKFKESLSDNMPDGFAPWFTWEVNRQHKIFFGHWAALQAKVDLPHAKALDAGCVWGNQLQAYRLSDKKIFSVDAI